MSADLPLSPEAYLAAIVESSNDAIIGKNLEGIIQWCNHATERIFGYSRAELIGKSIRILIPAERQAEEDAILEQIGRGERIEHFETVRIAKDGRRIDISLSVSPVRDGSGRIVGAAKIARDITGQKQDRAAQSYLAAIIASSEDAILAKTLDGAIQLCNPKAERLFGYSAPELMGRSIRMLIPPERQAEEDEILARIRRGERVGHFETARLTKDGRSIDVSVSASPIQNAQGEIIGLATSARDISEQKRIAAELAAQREWFRITLGSIGDAVIASDPEGRVTYMNASAEEVTGWTAAEALGGKLEEVFRIVSEKTRQPVENPAVLVMRSGHVVGLANHTVLIDRQGRERPIADSAAPIRADGRILGVVLVFRDVSEERRAADALVEQREWFETTLESIGDAVIATDVHGRVTFMNPVAEHLTGWKLAEARGRPCADVFNIVNESSRRPVDSPVTRVLAEGTVLGLANHTILIGSDGWERPIDDSGAPIRGRDGRIVGVVLVFRDVTDRRRGEVERREAALERERILEAERAARQAAEQANRAKDEFVAMVSHELRTPLNAILGWTQLMMKAEPDPEVNRRGLDVIVRNARLQSQLISDLLDVSRIVSGKLRLDLEPVDLAAVIEVAVETVRGDADTKRVTIDCDIDTRAKSVAGDGARLQQVVWNLLSNAIKFTPEGGRIAVRLRHHGSEAQIQVSDSGVGIRPEFLPQIFDRFQQAEQATTRRHGGLGLGLSIARHLVELHGGSIRAESKGIGQGTTLTVELPVGTKRRREDEDTAGAAPPEAGPTFDSLDGMCILVVEDERDTSDFLIRFLTNHGAAVVTARSADEALLKLREGRIDLLVSDIGLPGVDGYELMRRIRALPGNAGGAIPAIALTAYARKEDRTRSLRAGFQTHIAKPVEPAELLATITSFMQLIELKRRESRA